MSEEHSFDCAVCMELYTDPVSIPCGHNFCKLCLKRYWDSAGVNRCPLCNETFSHKLELRTNVSFRDVVDQFRKTNAAPACTNAECEAKDTEVACDVCTGVKMKAVKSCLVCIASYCEKHLAPHKIAAVLSRHKLIEPVQNLEDRFCEKHEMVLELFCKKEEKFICQVCAETEHSKHQVVKAEVASQQKMFKIKRKEREVELMIQDRQKRIEDINRMKIQAGVNKQDTKEAGMHVFESLVMFIEKTHKELTEELEVKYEAELKRLEELGKDLQLEIDELQKKQAELEELSHIQDHISLHQAMDRVYALPSMQNWPSIPVYELDFLGYVRTYVLKTAQFINLKIGEQSALELTKMRTYAEDITIDPDSAGPWLSISADGKELSQSPKKQKVPVSPARFTENTFAVATHALTMGRHYWEVRVRDKSNWMLGVAADSLDRGEQITPCPENSMWTVGLRDGGQYFVGMRSPLTLMVSPPPTSVGVFVDYEERRVSFINVKAQTNIFTFEQCNFTSRVYPLFDPCLAAQKNENRPLKIVNLKLKKVH